MRRFSTFASLDSVETITIDDLDRQLAQCLGVDGRASFSAIAEVLGVSDQTVARRYRKLRSSGAFRVVGLPSPKGGGGTSWFVRMRCVPGSGVAIAANLALRADTAWVQLLSGDTEVLCALRGEAPDGSESLLSRLPRSSRIVAVTAYSRLHMFTGGPDAQGFLQVLPDERVAPLRRATHASSGAGVAGGTAAGHAGHGGHGGHDGHDGQAGEAAGGEPGDLDSALFQALAVDGRTSYAELAAATGWSETRVRRRMDQLRDAGALYFDLEGDWAAFGFRASAWLWMSVPPSHLASVGTALAKFPEVAYATATTGPANLAACVICRDGTELYEFLTAKAGSLPGVERVEVAPIIRTVKQSSPVASPLA
jgi:DNA-binding Lrp family transcriptional regulator